MGLDPRLVHLLKHSTHLFDKDFLINKKLIIETHAPLDPWETERHKHLTMDSLYSFLRSACSVLRKFSGVTIELVYSVSKL